MQRGECLKSITRNTSISTGHFSCTGLLPSAGTLTAKEGFHGWMLCCSLIYKCTHILCDFRNAFPFIHKYAPLLSSPELLQCSPAFRGHTGYRSHKGASGWAWTPPSGWWSRARVWPGPAWSSQLHARGDTHVRWWMECGVNAIIQSVNSWGDQLVLPWRMPLFI